MFSSRYSPRPARIRGARAAPFFLAALTLVALSACESPTVPDEVDAVVEPAAAPATDAPLAAPAVFDPNACQYGTYETGGPDALYQICWPDTWNGSFIVYAHGYTFAGLPLAIPDEANELADFVTAQGFGFASTSYRVNGLAIKEGVEDMVGLAFKVRAEALDQFGATQVPVLIAGASEGGAVTTLAAEGYPGVFQGALSTCGPTGNFQRQLNYFGDFNVLFNYFFPRIFDGEVTPEGVDESVMLLWEGVYMPAAQAAVLGNPVAARKLVKVAGVSVASDDPADLWNAIERILWYNVFATNDALAKLGGQPFDNTRRWYSGSGQDFRLNWLVQRISADPVARAAVAADYQTSGDLAMPYVSLHTTGDEVVQFVQQPWYRLKALLSGASAEHSALPIFRYGHCNFQEGDLTVGLALLMLKVGAASSSSLATAMPTPTARATFQDLAKEMQPRR